MIRTVLRWFAPLLLAAACLLPVSAQQPTPAPTPAQPKEETERTSPVLQTAVAFVCAVVVLLIVCMPSRKN